MSKKCLLLAWIMVISLSISTQAGLGDWLRSIEVEVNRGSVSAISQPANPLTYTLSGEDYVLHGSAIEQDKQPIVVGNIKIPVLKLPGYTLGVYSEDNSGPQYRVGSSYWHSIMSGTRGIYVNAPIDKYRATVWIGMNKKKMQASDLYAYYEGETSTLTYGVGLKATARFLTLQIGLESSQPAAITEFSYHINGQAATPPDGYTPPPITFARNTSLRVGFGLNFSIATAAADNRQITITNSIDRSVPKEYRPFIENWARELVYFYGIQVLNGFTWDESNNRLIAKFTSNDRVIDEHMALLLTGPNRYPLVERYSINKTIDLVHQIQATVAKVPDRIVLQMELDSVHSTQPAVDGIYQTPYKKVGSYIAFIELTIKPELRVVNSWMEKVE